MADYPTALPSITRPTAGQKLNSPAAYIIVDEIADEIEAVATVLGLPDSSTAGSIWEYLTSVHTHDGTDSQPISGTGGVSDHDSLTGVSTDDHHTESHPVGGAQHTGTMSMALQGEEPGVSTADQSFTSNTTFADLTNLDFDMVASGVYIFEAVLWFTAATGGDMKIEITGPASPTRLRYQLIGPIDGDTALPSNMSQQTAIATAYSTTVTAGGLAVNVMAIIKGIIVNGANAGTVKLRGAQRASSGTATTFLAGSYVIAKKVG